MEIKCLSSAWTEPLQNNSCILPDWKQFVAIYLGGDAKTTVPKWAHALSDHHDHQRQTENWTHYLKYRAIKWNLVHRTIQTTICLCTHCSLETGREFAELRRTIRSLSQRRVGHDLWSERQLQCHQCQRRLLFTWISVCNVSNRVFVSL